MLFRIWTPRLEEIMENRAWETIAQELNFAVLLLLRVTT